MLAILLTCSPPSITQSQTRIYSVTDKKPNRYMNKWHIPDWLENEVRARDIYCVYCGVQMLDRYIPGTSRGRVATWEHIINDARIISRENIALCCASCNSSKGNKLLSEWIESDYCKIHGINNRSVAPVIAAALAIKTNMEGQQSVPEYPSQGAGSSEP